MALIMWLGAITAAVVIWCVVIRPWLRTQAWAAPFFKWIEPIELTIYKKSETILLARFKVLVGLLLTGMTQLGVIDITPLLPLVPDAYDKYVIVAWNMLPMVISFLGMIDEKLRNDTTQPIEMVAVANKDMTPAVVEAIAVADIAKVEAVTAVEIAKIQGAA